MKRFEHVRHRAPLPLPQPRPLILAVSPMRSGVNLSRLVRLAGCAGITRMLYNGPQRIDAKIARDAIDVVRVDRRRSLAPPIQELRDQGYRCVGLEQTTNSTCLYEYRYERRTVLLIGSEREGLTDKLLRLVDDTVEIPVYGQPASYNVVTATAMAVYEYCRQFPAG
ncbi:MAG: hypothetical protein KatS3mg111_4034 [Pirellulaceae bacterium]|nr:MAG: hypothetical protein KatS3mg111_4034 [Pirellulaceae bacterium]